MPDTPDFTRRKEGYHPCSFQCFTCNVLHAIITKKAKKLVSAVKEVDKDNSVKIAFSSIINREYQNIKIRSMMSIITLKNTATQQVWILLTIQILMDHV